MKLWSAMYGIIWIAFFQIILVLFNPLGYTITVSIHIVLAVALLAFAFYVYRHVRATACPDRIKRITKTTWYLSIFQAILGVAFAAGNAMSLGDIFSGVIGFLHVGTALAIITQASSSATAYDMWEEKEFLATPTK